MRLSSVDHVFVGEQGYSIEFMFYYKHKLDLKKLRSRLKVALKKFKFLNYTLSKDGQAQHLVFKEASNIDFLDCLDKELPQLDNLQQLTKHYIEVKSVENQKLFRVQLAHYKNGSTLAVNISHCLADGYSFFLFMGYWAQLCRTRKTQWIQYLKLMLFKPQLCRKVLSPSKHPSSVSELEVMEKTGLFYGPKRDFGSFEENPFEIIKFSKAEIMEELSVHSPKSKMRLSLHDIICVRLLRMFAKKWNSPGQDVFVSSAFDYRRVHSGLTKLYFGNAVMVAAAKMTFEELYEKQVWEIAEKIRRSTSSIKEKNAQESLAYLEGFRREHGLEAMERFHVAHPSQGFLITNLSRVPLNSLDFGGGAPFQTIPLVPAPRTMVVLTDKTHYIIRVCAPLRKA